MKKKGRRKALGGGSAPPPLCVKCCYHSVHPFLHSFPLSLLMRPVDLTQHRVVWRGLEWPSNEPSPSTRDMLVRLERNEAFISWLQPLREGAGLNDQIPAILMAGRYYTISLRMMKAIWRHVRLKKGFVNREEVPHVGPRLRIPTLLLTEKIRTQQRFNVRARPPRRAAVILARGVGLGSPIRPFSPHLIMIRSCPPPPPPPSLVGGKQVMRMRKVDNDHQRAAGRVEEIVAEEEAADGAEGAGSSSRRRPDEKKKKNKDNNNDGGSPPSPPPLLSPSQMLTRPAPTASATPSDTVLFSKDNPSLRNMWWVVNECIVRAAPPGPITTFRMEEQELFDNLLAQIRRDCPSIVARSPWLKELC